MNYLSKHYVSLLLAKTACLLIATCCFSCSSNSQKKQPNVLIITADDLGWADLPLYGNTFNEAPNISRFAEDAVMFTNAYAAAPVCSPTRASIMTGISPAQLHLTTWIEASHRPAWATEGKTLPPITEENLSLDYITLAEVLKEKGYLTAHVGKWHLGDLSHFPENQGFDVCFGTTDKGAPPSYFFPYRGRVYDNDRYVPDLESSSEGKYFENRNGEYLADRLTDEAIKIIKEAKNRPLFLNMAFYSVHAPIMAKEKLVNHFTRKKSEMKPSSNPVYAGMIFSLDENIGRIIQCLKDENLYDNTIIIFLSDNGGFEGEWDGQPVTDNKPLKAGKGFLYEGGIRIPMVIKWPEVSNVNTKTDVPATTMDILPSILDYFKINLDAEYSKKIEGESIIQVIKNPLQTVDNRPLFWHFPHTYETKVPTCAMRMGDWKIIRFFETGNIELYNLKDDLGEENDLAGRYPERLNEMSKMLNNWLIKVDAQLPEPNPAYKP